MNILAWKSAVLATCLVTLAGCSNAWNKTIASITDKSPPCIRDGWYGYRQTPCPAKPVSKEITAIPPALENEGKLYALRQENRELSRRVRDLERGLDQQVTARDKELVGLRKDRSIEQAGAKQRITDLERQLAARDEELAGLRRDLMSEQADAKSQNIAAKERVTDLETQLAARDKELVGLRSELSAGQAADKQRVADLERQLAARDEELARLRNELSTEQAAAKQRVTDLEMQVAARDKELAGLRSELSTELAKLQEAQRGLIRELRPEIEKGDITVDLNNERLLINLASGYLFATGEDQLKPDGADALKDVGAILKDYPEYKVSVEGHTDNRPIRSAALKKKFPTNQELSEARAGSAAEALTAGGLSTVSTVGYGEKRPVASNTTEEGRAKNRRVEVRVTK